MVNLLVVAGVVPNAGAAALPPPKLKAEPGLAPNADWPKPAVAPPMNDWVGCAADVVVAACWRKKLIYIYLRN